MRRAVVALVSAAVLLAITCGSAAANRTELASAGPGGANVSNSNFLAASKDGTKAFFSTGDALVLEDADGLCPRGSDPYTGQEFPPTPCIDIYVRDLAARTTKLVSTGPTGGSGHFDASFPRFPRFITSQDGNRVFFETAEPLVSEDGHEAVDVYERDLGTSTTKLISTGAAGGSGSFDASFAGASADGSRAFFITDERLVPEDTDSRQDGYLRSGNTTSLLSFGPNGGNGPWDAGASPASEDGSWVLVGTREALVAADTDNCPSLIPGPCGPLHAEPRDGHDRAGLDRAARESGQLRSSHRGSHARRHSRVFPDGRAARR